MMTTPFSLTTSNPNMMTTALSVMPRKNAPVEAVEQVETKAEATDPTPSTTTGANTPPTATGKNVALPLGLAAGTALAGGIGAGQGYWHFVPNGETISETDALAKVTSDTTLEATAKKELELLRDEKNDEMIKDFLVYQESKESKPYDEETRKGITKKLKQGFLNPNTLLTDRKKDFESYQSDYNEILRKALEGVTDSDEIKQITQEKEERLKLGTTLLKHIEAYEKLDLKDTPMVQKLTQGELKFNTQQVDGFMKWGYAEAKDLEKIGGEELVKHANASKIALGVGALAVGLGTGALTYLLINKPKTSPPSSAE